MTFNRKFLVLGAMAAVVTSAVAFTAPAPPPENIYKNLKILPKDISKEQLGKVMHGFNDALGVKCSFCHAPSKDTAVHYPDFASDELPEKDIARSMMRMTVKINKKFFSNKKPVFGELMDVSCATCHHGQPHPEEPGEKDHGPNPAPAKDKK
ncbi:MAG: c-type cytochrome [Chitinophagaceae bacterium]